jgi:hypothetical protein
MGGLYWARINEAGDYEIRSVTREGVAHSVTGGIIPKEGFEEHYEKTSPLEQPRLLLTEARKDNA